MRAEYGGNGEKKVKEMMRFDGDEPIHIYEISSQDAETLKSLLLKIQFNAAVDYD